MLKELDTCVINTHKKPIDFANVELVGGRTIQLLQFEEGYIIEIFRTDRVTEEKKLIDRLVLSREAFCAIIECYKMSGAFNESRDIIALNENAKFCLSEAEKQKFFGKKKRDA